MNYQLFLDGTLIAATSGIGPFTFLQPLPSKHIKGTYTLEAIASNGNTSLPIPIVIQKKS